MSRCNALTDGSTSGKHSVQQKEQGPGSHPDPNKNPGSPPGKVEQVIFLLWGSVSSSLKLERPTSKGRDEEQMRWSTQKANHCTRHNAHSSRKVEFLSLSLLIYLFIVLEGDRVRAWVVPPAGREQSPSREERKHWFWGFSLSTISIWLEEDAVCTLAIYLWLSWCWWPGRRHFKQRVSDNRKARWLLYYYLVCCVTESPYCVIQSLSQLPGSHRWCLCFPAALLSQNFYISRAITASWLSRTYPIMLLSCTQHWLLYFLLAATILWALSCRLSDSVCLLAVCALHWGKGRCGISICVHIRRETMPKHFQRAGSLLTGMPQAEEEGACSS